MTKQDDGYVGHLAGDSFIRTEIEVLPADNPNQKLLGWSVCENIGIGIPNPRPVTRFVFPVEWTEAQRELFADYLEMMCEAEEDEERVLLYDEFKQKWRALLAAQSE
jgi:hypothetical protein